MKFSYNLERSISEADGSHSSFLGVCTVTIEGTPTEIASTPSSLIQVMYRDTHATLPNNTEIEMPFFAFPVGNWSLLSDILPAYVVSNWNNHSYEVIESGVNWGYRIHSPEAGIIDGIWQGYELQVSVSKSDGVLAELRWRSINWNPNNETIEISRVSQGIELLTLVIAAASVLIVAIVVVVVLKRRGS